MKLKRWFSHRRYSVETSRMREKQPELPVKPGNGHRDGAASASERFRALKIWVESTGRSWGYIILNKRTKGIMTIIIIILAAHVNHFMSFNLPTPIAMPDLGILTHFLGFFFFYSILLLVI